MLAQCEHREQADVLVYLVGGRGAVVHADLVESRSPRPIGPRDLAQEAARLELTLRVGGQSATEIQAQIQGRGPGAVAEGPQLALQGGEIVNQSFQAREHV